jgi:hypothetical protein
VVRGNADGEEERCERSRSRVACSCGAIAEPIAT